MKVYLVGEPRPYEVDIVPGDLWMCYRQTLKGTVRVDIYLLRQGKRGAFRSVRRIDAEQTFGRLIIESHEDTIPPPPRVPTMPSAEMAVCGHDTDPEETRDTPVGEGA